jgi:tetratricopeptide (TPR) repeat protein
MGIDYRSDHSIRIPRPDLSLTYGVPNSCKECHWDKTDQWSTEFCTKWYGIKKRSHYGTVLAKGRRGETEAQTELIRLANDQLSPAIVRASALSLLRSYPNKVSFEVFERALMDPDPLVRHTAIHDLARLKPKLSSRKIIPLLYDPVKAVRIQAAMTMTGLPRNHLNSRQRKVFDNALKEYQEAMEHVGDFPQGRFNLGNMHMNLGNQGPAEEHFKAAIQIDRLFYPAKVNLAMLLNGQGRKREAEMFLREVMKENPDLYDVAYSLGLLLVEQNNYKEAVDFLRNAARGMPDRARVQYNLGLLLQQEGMPEESEIALRRALEIEPDDLDYLHAMADYYLRRNRLEDAKLIAKQLNEKHPTNTLGRQLLDVIDRLEKQETD